MGSVMAWILLFADLESGIDGYSGKPIHSCLSGQPAVVYILLNNYFPMLAQLHSGRLRHRRH